MYMYIPVCIHCLAQINLAYTYMLAIVPSSKFSLMSAKKCSASCMSLLNLHRPCISVHYIRYDWQAPSWELNLYQIDFYIVWNNGWIIHNTPPTFWTWKPLQLSMQKTLSLQLTVFFSDSGEWAQFITMWRRTTWHILSQILSTLSYHLGN